MSYDISLKDPKTGEAIYFNEKHQFKGGTFALDGTAEAWINITYNYAKFYYVTINPEKGIRWLYGKTGKDCISILETAIKQLGTKQSNDYWEATPGNAGVALVILLEFAKARSDGVFDGD